MRSRPSRSDCQRDPSWAGSLGGYRMRALRLIAVSEGAEAAALLGMDETLRFVPHIVVSCHDFVADGGGEPALRTYDDVKRILQHSGYSLRAAREDWRPWFRYYLYGAKSSLCNSGG